MINIFEVNETNKMIEQENLDVRTITMGISLLDCIDPDLDALNQKIYEKITTKARNLVATGDEIATEYGIPVVNKRISVTPIALVGGKQRNDSGRGASYPLHSSGNGRNRARLQFCKRWFHQDRYQHGCRKADGRDHPRNSRGY